MERIAQLLRKMSDAVEDEIQEYLSLHEAVSYKKGDILLEKGQIEEYLYFIESGIIRCFIAKEKKDDVKEITFSLVFSGWFFSAYDSFITQNPVRYTVECLSDVEIYRISYASIQSIYRKSDFGNEVGRHAAELLYINKTKREISLLSESPDERYQYLLDHYPKEIMDVPLKYIASYIGVTLQALSKIRKRIFKRN